MSLRKVDLAAAGFMMACLCFFDATATQPTNVKPVAVDYIKTDVCSVLKNPSLFLNKEISIRGSIFTGVDGANITDEKCSNEGIQLTVEDARNNQADISALFRKIRRGGNHGFATLSGKFITSHSPINLYTLSIHRAWNVTLSGD